MKARFILILVILAVLVSACEPEINSCISKCVTISCQERNSSVKMGVYENTNACNDGFYAGKMCFEECK